MFVGYDLIAMSKIYRVKRLVIMAVLLGLAGCAQPSPEELVANAIKQLEKNDHRSAIIGLKSALQAEPENSRARLLLGQSLLALKDYASAEKELVRARELQVPADSVYPLLAKALLSLGQHERLIKEIQPVPTLGQESLAVVHAYRARALLALRRSDEALKELTSATVAGPHHHEVLLTQALFAWRDRQSIRALELVDRALMSNQSSIDALYFKAKILGAQGQYDEVVKIYEKITQLDPTEYLAFLGIAELSLRAQGGRDRKTALQAAEKAIASAEQIAPQALAVKQARAMLELQRGRLKEANQAVLQVLKVAPDYAPALHLHALVNFGLGNTEQSRRSAERLLQQLPDNPSASKLLVANLLKIGDIKRSRQLVDSALSRNPDDPALLALAGDVYLRSGDADRGMAMLQRAAQLEPNRSEIKVKLATGALATGDTDLAINALEEAVKLSEGVTSSDLALVGLHLKRQEFDKALRVIDAIESKSSRNAVTLTLRASALLGKGDRAASRQAMEQALNVQPTYLPALINLARLDLQDGKPDQARKRFETLLKQDKDNLQAMLSLAELALMQHQNDQAISWLERAAAAHPKELRPRVALVRQYLHVKNDPGKALSHAQAAAELNPEDLEAIALLGATQLSTGRREAALATYQRMTQQWPKVADGWVGQALVRQADGQIAAARSALQNALKLQPDHLPAQSLLIKLELTDKKPQAALAIARQVQARQPQSAVGYALEGDIHLQGGDLTKAISAYEQAWTRGADAATFAKLHRAYLAAGDVKRADQRLATWLTTRPRDLQVRMAAAESYLMAGHSRQAIRQYEEVLQIAPNHALASNNLANLYHQLKDPRALPLAEQAVSLAPDNPVILDTLGWILVERGDTARGIELLGKAASLAPKSGLIRYHYGAALAKAGRKQEAKRELEAALASGQRFAGEAEARTLLRNL